jgi:hypothetical protein
MPPAYGRIDPTHGSLDGRLTGAMSGGRGARARNKTSKPGPFDPGREI